MLKCVTLRKICISNEWKKEKRAYHCATTTEFPCKFNNSSDANDYWNLLKWKRHTHRADKIKSRDFKIDKPNSIVVKLIPKIWHSCKDIVKAMIKIENKIFAF